MKISHRGESIQESPIRKLSAVAIRTKEAGKRVYHLNIGQPDIPTPPEFYDAIRSYSEKVLSYGPSDGIIELKDAMINYFKRYDIGLTRENLTITYGGSEAVSFAFSIIGDPGDEIIIPEPFYTNYNGYATMSNLNIVPVHTTPETGFHLPDVSEIEKKITKRTKAILICSPNNPTGTVFSEEEIRPSGLGAGGVMAIKLSSEDQLVGAGLPHAGNTQAECGHRFGSFQGLDDVEYDLLDRELTLDEQVCAAGYRLGQHLPGLVGQDPHGLCSAGIYSDHTGHFSDSLVTDDPAHPDRVRTAGRACLLRSRPR